MKVDGALSPPTTVVRRDVLRGKVWTAAPYRVIRDTGTSLMLACWPGVEMIAPTTWIQWMRTGDEAVRKQAIPNLAADRWELDRWAWRDTTLLARFDVGQPAISDSAADQPNLTCQP